MEQDQQTLFGCATNLVATVAVVLLSLANAAFAEQWSGPGFYRDKMTDKSAVKLTQVARAERSNTKYEMELTCNEGKDPFVEIAVFASDGKPHTIPFAFETIPTIFGPISGTLRRIQIRIDSRQSETEYLQQTYGNAGRFTLSRFPESRLLIQNILSGELVEFGFTRLSTNFKQFCGQASDEKTAKEREREAERKAAKAREAKRQAQEEERKAFLRKCVNQNSISIKSIEAGNLLSRYCTEQSELDPALRATERPHIEDPNVNECWDKIQDIRKMMKLQNVRVWSVHEILTALSSNRVFTMAKDDQIVARYGRPVVERRCTNYYDEIMKREKQNTTSNTLGEAPMCANPDMRERFPDLCR